VGAAELALVVVQVRVRGDEAPAARAVARVDLDADGMAGEERLVALRHADLAGDLRLRGRLGGRGLSCKSGHGHRGQRGRLETG
jgi:hypothetical protein